MNRLDNYQESEDDWGDLLDNNDNIDDVLRTSIYSNRSNVTNSSQSPSKPVKHSVNNNALNINVPNEKAKKKPYQSISLYEFENAMSNQEDHTNKTISAKNSPVKANDTILLKSGLQHDKDKALKNNLQYEEDFEDGFEDGLDEGFLTIGKNQTIRRQPKLNIIKNDDDSDMEDGIVFPDTFNIPKSSNAHGEFSTPAPVNRYNTVKGNNYFKLSRNAYSSTLDLSPANLSSSSIQFDKSSNSASIYSESETDATDYYNDIEFQTDDFEKLLELRLRRARYQAELEEKEFYLMQQQKKSLNKKTGKMLLARKNELQADDVMDLPDDTFVYPSRNDSESENEEHFLDGFHDFEEDLSFAIEKDQDLHRNVIIKHKGRSRNDVDRKSFYSHPLASDINLNKSKSRSPKKQSPNDRLLSKKSMPQLRAASQAQFYPNVRKASSSALLNGVKSNEKFKKNGNKKMLVQPVRRAQYGYGDELDDLNELDVDYAQERKSLNQNFYMDGASTLRNPYRVAPQHKYIDITQYMEGPVKKSILKSSPTRRFESSPRKLDKKRKKIGLIKHLSVPLRQYALEGYNGNKMVYNPETYKWEGNEVDAKRFATIKSTKQPALITFLSKKNGPYSYGTVKPSKQKVNVRGRKITSQDDSDFEELSMDGLQVEGNMYFNPRKLCWISLHAEDDSDDDPFKDIKDLEVITPTVDENTYENPERRLPLKKKSNNESLERLFNSRLNLTKPSTNFKSSIHRNQKEAPNNRQGSWQQKASEEDQQRYVAGRRGFSNMSRASTASFNMGDSKSPTGSEFEVKNEYNVSDELVEKFRQEETRWIRKVKNWFQPGGDERQDRDHLYEIRNMVMGGSR